MKTDVIEISPQGKGMAEALRQTEKAAAWRDLSSKEGVRLRLLSEEMMGMLRTIVGGGLCHFWIESEGKSFTLHLTTDVRMNADMREELLETTTSGKNEAVQGFMSRVRDILTRVTEPDGVGVSPLEYGFSYVDVTSFDDASLGVTTHGMTYGWSMKAYKSAVAEHREEEQDKWDELEKSITARLADEIRIFIRGNAVELVIEKAF